MIDQQLTNRHSLSQEEEQIYCRRGRALVSQFSIMLKTTKLYDADNKNFRTQIDQTFALVTQFLESDSELTLQAQSGYLFFCGVRIRYEIEGLAASRHLMEFLHKLGISGFRIDSGISSLELESSIKVLTQTDTDRANDCEAIRDRLSAASVELFSPLAPIVEKQEELEVEREKRRSAKRTFFFAMNNLKNVMGMINANRPVDLTRTKRVIQSLVDQILEDERYLLELTALRSHDEYTFLHCTNVCTYSICLGSALNLTKIELASLGFAALFHDIGKTSLPLEMLNKPTEFTEDEWSLMRQHPTCGVLALAKTMPFEDRVCRAMLVAFEHHFNLDGTGYPIVKFRRTLNLYSKIVAICDVFDAMTSGRAYQKANNSPEAVLQNMMRQTGYKFDPHLFKVFLNVVSIYPPGTVLLLDRNELAIVIGKNSGDLFRPIVKVIGNSHGMFETGLRVNLADRDIETGQYQRSIIRVIAPNEVSIDATKYILEDN